MHVYLYAPPRPPHHINTHSDKSLDIDRAVSVEKARKEGKANQKNKEAAAELMEKKENTKAHKGSSKGSSKGSHKGSHKGKGSKK